MSSQPLNPWQYKPWWCQPWSIALTGISIISGSWLLFHSLWITVLVSIPIFAWMGFFLVVWPPMMAEYLAQLPDANIESDIPK
ncbi:MAG: DUF6737 family protein [Geitlerinemataceae cyanobacterium]